MAAAGPQPPSPPTTVTPVTGSPPPTGMARVWRTRGPVAWALWPISLIYGALVALRRGLYRLRWLRSEHAGVPVIVVGNVIAGGAGKTPVVIALVRHLQAQGWQPGVISRGYGRSTHDCRAVLPDSPAPEVGDEPALIARATRAPVFVAPRRITAARALRAAHPGTDVLVCDDGLQHLALARDLEICVFNSDGVGNGFMLASPPPGVLPVLRCSASWRPMPCAQTARSLLWHPCNAGLCTPSPPSPGPRNFLPCCGRKGCNWRVPRHCLITMISIAGSALQIRK